MLQPILTKKEILAKEDFQESKDTNQVKVFNVDRSIKVMSWFVKPPKRGQYPSINPIYNGLIVYECNRILDSQSGELGLTPSEATNLCFGGENGFITQRYER